MSDWLTKFLKRQDNTLQFKKENSNQVKSNKKLIKYISSNSTSQCNLTEGPFIYKVTGALGDLWGSPQKYLPIGGSEIKILKANRGAKEKRMCLKEQQIYQSNCLEFTWDFMLNKYQCL